MLKIEKQAPDAARNCHPHLLPCRIHHDGPVEAGDRYWRPEKSDDGKQTAYFRGRRLQGRTLTVPDGYKGMAARRSYDLPHLTIGPRLRPPHDR